MLKDLMFLRCRHLVTGMAVFVAGFLRSPAWEVALAEMTGLVTVLVPKTV